MGNKEEFMGEIDVKPHIESIQDVIERLAKQEVYRLERNLGALDSLELMLIDNVKTQLQMMGRVDNKTLLDVIKTFNDSVKRSNDLIKGNSASGLISILEDSRIQEEENRVQDLKQEDEEQGVISLDGRKRITALLSAVLNDSELENNEG